MPDTFTTNLNLTQPEDGSSSDTWGAKLNADLALIDALFDTTGTGVVVRHNARDNAAVIGVDVSQAAGTFRNVNYLSGTSQRWAAGASTEAETGANAGSHYVISRWDDTGAIIDNPFVILRPTGVVLLSVTPMVGSNAIYHQGNLPAVLAEYAEPVGTIKMYAGGGDPSGGIFLLCDGRAISRTTYATLFGIVGTAYGVGDGTTTFNIPNFKERVPVGATSSASLIPQYDATVLGHTFGEGEHTLVSGEMPSHSHSVTDPEHSHVLGAGTGAPNGGSFTAVQATGSGPSSQSAATGISIQNAGGGGAHNIVQPSIVVNFIIRVS